MHPRLAPLPLLALSTACAASTPQPQPPASALRPISFSGYAMADLRVADTAHGRGYAFVLERARDSAPEWAVRLSGEVAVKQQRVAIAQHAELKPANRSQSAYTLDLASSPASHIAGTLAGAAKAYRVEGIPRGTLLFGDTYGLRALQFLEGDRVVAIVSFENSRLDARVAADLDHSEESLFASAALIAALTHRSLDQAGARPTAPPQVGLSDFTCITFTCTTLINGRGETILLGDEPVSQHIHRAQPSE